MTKLVVCVSILLVGLTYCDAKDLVCTGPHEVAECRSTCELECATLDKVCTINYIQCEYKCWCRKHFARNSHGICIPTARCPQKIPCPCH
ncbi:uncharacterized protein CBL_06737 [Carabus blaptoides fortunei]